MAYKITGKGKKKNICNFLIHNIIVNGDTTMFDFVNKYNTFDMIKMAMRYEAIRKLNAVQFVKIYKQSISGNEKFDDIIDELMKQ